jgi:Zn-dependent protease
VAVQIFSYKNIPIRLHSSFLILAGALIGYEYFTLGWQAAATWLFIGSVLFGSVLLHEIGHALAAKRFGFNTKSITLYPFGGIAAIEMEPSDVEEFWIAIAGPAVNFAIAIVSLPILFFGYNIFSFIISINILMGVFNMIPAYPMDGGRVLRAILSRKMSKARATQKALSISKIFSWTFVIAGFLLNWFSLLLVGGFLLYVIKQERRRLELTNGE